jgi:hypothetical protein
MSARAATTAVIARTSFDGDSIVVAGGEVGRHAERDG